MDTFKMLCALVVAIMDEYSEKVVENGTFTFRFDCDDYHYECKAERILKVDDDIWEGDNNGTN